MVKKAPRRNAYYMFMLEYKRREESRGKRFGIGLQEVSKLASEAWGILPQEEKDLFKKKADDYNKSEERSQGWSGPSYKKKKKNPPPFPNRALTIKEEKQRREKEFIQNVVDKMTMNDLLDHVFYLIHVNVFCKTLKEEYVPAEIAISKFSLREGVTDVFHRILNPGQTPLGYSYEIIQHSEKTHRIPLDFVKATRGYLGIYKGITDFLRSRDDSSHIPPVYTMFDEPFHNCSMSAVKYSLKGIWETVNIDDDEDDGIDDDDKYEKTFRVLSLPILFFHLKNKCISTFHDDTVAFENTSEANIELLNDKYEFNEELACQFHKEIDNVRYCSQSYTVRWAQVIREHCLKNLDSDDEEEHQPVEDEEERIKRERELAIKKEKAREAKAEEDLRSIKSERDIKKEKDDIKIKKEKDEKNYALKKEKDEALVKKEKDEKYRDVKKEKEENYRDIKKEKDEVKIKYEKDGSRGESYSRSIKSERDSEHRSRRDRNYDDVRVKSERDERRRSYDDDRYRGYDDVRVKRERDDRYRRSDDVRMKRERDERHRSPEDYRRRRYRTETYDLDYDSALKTEHIDIPYESDGASSDSRDSYRYPKSSRDRDSRSSRYDYDSGSTSKHRDSRDSRSRDSYYNKETVRPEDSTIKIERLDTSVKIKTEHPDSRASQSDTDSIRTDYDSILKTEHLDIPFDIKSERCDEDYTSTPRNTSSVPEPHQSAPVRIKRPTSSSVSRSDSFPMPIPIKIEQSYDEVKTSNKSDFPQPIPIKVEKDANSDSPRPVEGEKYPRDDFPKSIKIEKDTHVDEQRSSRTQPDTHSDERGFPMPIPIKVEKDVTSEPSKKELPAQTGSEKEVFPMPIPIKIEKDETPRPTPQKELPKQTDSERQDFPMPIQIKMEKCEPPRPAPQKEPPTSTQSEKRVSTMPLPIKMEQGESPRPAPEKDFPMPMIIKTEKSSKPSQPVESSLKRDDFPLPIQIKAEKDVRIKKEPSSTSRKRNYDFIDLVDSDEEENGPSSAKTKNSQIENETESVINFAPGNVKNEPPPDSYSAHGIKHEECDIDPSDVVRHETTIVKKEISYEIEKVAGKQPSKH